MPGDSLLICFSLCFSIFLLLIMPGEEKGESTMLLGDLNSKIWKLLIQVTIWIFKQIHLPWGQKGLLLNITSHKRFKPRLPLVKWCVFWSFGLLVTFVQIISPQIWVSYGGIINWSLHFYSGHCIFRLCLTCLNLMCQMNFSWGRIWNSYMPFQS